MKKTRRTHSEYNNNIDLFTSIQISLLTIISSSVMDHQLPPYAVVVTVGQGRGLRATRDIEKNEIVLIDEPFVMGPFTVSSPLCLSCNARPLTSSSTTLTKCPGLCGFWLCCQKCCSKDQNFWHAMYECPLLSNAIENGNLKLVLPKCITLCDLMGRGLIYS